MDKNRTLLRQSDPSVYAALEGEEHRQRDGMELIPSENYAYPEVLAVLGSVFTNKYSEGYPGKRYYGGQEFTDQIEELARERAKLVFRAEHVNVQPLSGSPMNQAVYHAYLNPGDTVLSMELSHGGHLTHGAPVSHMGKIYNFVRYKTLTDQGGIFDWDDIHKLARHHKPKIVLCGHSSYPRDLDYASFKKIADDVGALTMADVSHVGGLIAADVLNKPMDAGFDFATTTTHKSLRGPRGGMILCRKQHAKTIDAAVFPGLQGGPHMNQVAATAITMGKATTMEFRSYAQQVLINARVLAETLNEEGLELVTGGTENHLVVLNTVKSLGLEGHIAETVLDQVGITTNKQIVPDDPNPPLRPSGIRMGTPAATSRGLKESDIQQISYWIVDALRNHSDKKRLDVLKNDIRSFCRNFPVPGIS